ncbi:GTP 3',8-cyclase MoaA [Shewanella baltica]|uniref:GTP 3',8-cyclase n=1 Tax=Shewanella baltica (strain OS195) TaxID=399599 RepID=A9KW45_SHEB9|nr:GTP 3',8-cyclase MoaA [Shewanella baltica]ABX51619.1 molybdenum cofactor biosynthesis protein A [Shewanella baltica OS195]ADT96614.1 molybdenum cofactor biosynthesis protein A [Shewanella baltica OS678]EHC07439.1 molybdenum cofactor biosynthesis protein A [Shewanella baltica OS625]MCS6235481.1 GTP 3',8-cyclase MoaA [Shewanella baltica]MCS6270099.1 GTP 3',8-cyclase MoaA [Shewanella baltica]
MSLMVDSFGRKVEYLRLSVTDRCDFRCVYCMTEDPCFLPKDHVLHLEELAWIAQAFTELGVTKIRLTGGEPLVRTDCDQLVSLLGKLPGLTDLSMTTNGSRLTKFAKPMFAAGLKRLNISLDTLNPTLFTQLTRNGKLDRVIDGIDAAIAAGFERIKINAVILKQQNDNEVIDLVDFCRGRRLDIAFIEEMPLGEIDERKRARHCSSDEVKAIIESRYPLQLSSKRTGGPARYYTMADSPIHIGFISPHSHNFCHECNRVRVTVEGQLLLCLGNEHAVDLKSIVREFPADIERLKAAILAGINLKPKQHDFGNNQVQILRFMNATGG